MWGGETECGLSVLARAAARPAVGRLHPTLLPALVPGDAVLVSGEAGSGCSMLLYDMVARALLPQCWRGVDLGGCGAHVLFLDTDLHFCVLQLSVIAEGQVKRAVRRARRQMKAAAERGSNAVGGGSSCAAHEAVAAENRAHHAVENGSRNIDCTSLTICSNGETVAVDARVQHAVECEINQKATNSHEIGGSDAGIDRSDREGIMASESVNFIIGNPESAHKKKKHENGKIDTELNTEFSAKASEEQDSMLDPSRVTKSDPPLPSPSADFSSLEWLRKIQRAKLKRLVKELVTSCLANFLYLRCTYSTQFVTTLLSLDSLLAAHPQVSLVCVDSLSNFYWHDRSFGRETWKSTEQYYNRIMKSVLNGVSKNKVVFVGVQQPLFARQKRRDQNSNSAQEREYEHYNFLGPSLANDVQYKIQIKKVRANERHDFVVSEREGIVKTLSAVHRAEGINWIQNE